MMTSPTFDLGHLNDLNCDVKEALKLSIFVVEKKKATSGDVIELSQSEASGYRMKERTMLRQLCQVAAA